MMLQLNPSIPLETPLGAGEALFYEDDGQEMWWTVALRDTRAIVTFRNRQVRYARCYGVGIDDEKMREIIR